MQDNQTDHNAIIAVLEKELDGLDAEKATFLMRINSKRGKLQQAIQLHKELDGLRSDEGIRTNVVIEQPVTPHAEQPIELAITKNAFRDLSLIEATIKYLEMAQTGKTTRELGEAFKQGGKKPTQSDKFFFDSIRTAIRKRGARNGIKKIGNYYWLTKWPHTPKVSEDVAEQGSFSDEG